MSGAFSKSFERSLAKIRELAKARGHGYMTLEHVVLAVLDEPAAHGLFRQHEIPLSAFQEELLEFIERHTPRLDGAATKVEETRSVSRVQARAQMIFEIPTGIHVLEMLFEEPHSYAVQLLRKHGISRDQVAKFRARVDRARFNTQDTVRLEPAESRKISRVPRWDGAAAQRFVTDLNQRARDGGIDVLVGRDEEMQRMIQTLGRRRKNNVVLVGEAGVGKTALAEGLAWKIVRGEVPQALAAATVLSLHVGGLVAGTRFRGDFEERMKNLLSSLRQRQDAILFIDEIHTLVGAGSAAGTVMDAADLLKPLLATGELRCIGASTWREYRRVFETDAALARRFQRIEVREPSTAETHRILEGLKGDYESYHRVRYGTEALRAMVDLSVKHLHDRRLPDKAIDVMDETGSRCRMAHEDAAEPDVRLQDVERTVALMARIPERSVTVSAQQELQGIEERLRRFIFGQDDAIRQLVRALRLARAKLNPARRPLGSFLFSGPTGVGKTEVCRQLAAAMGVELLRFDMSEYMERHSVARLIGAPPGYVGYDEGGLLTEAVQKHPCAVLLLDEAEKAHPDVLNVLLQIMDHGTLTDGNGREVDFRNLVLALTCNAGASEAARTGMGFAPAAGTSDMRQALERAFAPEFRNRLDAIVQFAPLEPDGVLAVVGKLLAEVQEALAERGMTLKADVRARRWLAREGFDPAMGVRPMERVVREHVQASLADRILSGELQAGGTVRLTASRKGLRMTVAAAAVPADAAAALAAER